MKADIETMHRRNEEVTYGPIECCAERERLDRVYYRSYKQPMSVRYFESHHSTSFLVWSS